MGGKGCTSDRPGVIRGCADVRASDTRYHARPFLKGSPFRDRRAPVAKAAPTPHAAGATAAASATAAAGATAAAAGTAAAALDPLDLYAVRSALSEEERLVQESVARLVDAEVLPLIQRCFEEHRFPKELIPKLASLGLLGSSLTGYECAGLNAICYGLICQELERGDSGIRSFVSVQSSLCMYPIWAFGSEEQKQRYLPRMARGELIGCFGLTEPHGGSDPANMKTHAKKRGGDRSEERRVGKECRTRWAPGPEEQRRERNRREARRAQ